MTVSYAGSVDTSRVALSNRVLNGKHVKYKIEEEKSGDNRDHRTERGDVISTSKRIWVVGDTTRHSGKTQEVHREEGEVYTDKECSEVNFTQGFVVRQTNHLLYSVVEAGENSENGTHGKNVVEVRDDVVGIVESYIKPCVSDNDSGHATNSEKKDKPDSEKHWCTEVKRTASHRCQSAKDFNSGRDSNNHSCCSEIGARIDI